MIAEIPAYAGPSNYVALHNHSIYSALDGIATPADYAGACEERGYCACALTEHGNMASVPDAYSAFRTHKVKFIPGVELYYNDYEPWRQQFAAEGGKIAALKAENPGLHARVLRNRHLTVLAKNARGVENLFRIVTLAHCWGYYYKPRVWLQKLAKYREGLIVLSGCVNGPISHELRLDAEAEQEGRMVQRTAGLDKTAAIYAKVFRAIFGEDFFLELQMPCAPALYDQAAFRGLLDLSDSLGIKTVLTNDAHYLAANDYELQRVMMAVDQKTTIDNSELVVLSSGQQYFKSRAELWQTFHAFGYQQYATTAQFETMCDNTLLLADKCENWKPDTSFKTPHWSAVQPDEDAATKLRQLVAEALRERGLNQNPKRYIIDGREVTYCEQAELELERFISKGFASYCLITWDLIQYGKRQGWPFGPRGSVGGSLVCFLLGITSIDPLRWNLSFDRFLASSRGGYLLKVTMA